jgi:hypothetical protein
MRDMKTTTNLKSSFQWGVGRTQKDKLASGLSVKTGVKAGPTAVERPR